MGKWCIIEISATLPVDEAWNTSTTHIFCLLRALKNTMDKILKDRERDMEYIFIVKILILL